METRVDRVSTKRDRVLDMLKCVAMFMVISGHCFQHTGYGNSYLNIPIFRLITMIQMPLFIFISGYVAYRSLTSSSLQTLVKRKYFGLLQPMILFALAQFVINYIVYAKDGFNPGSVPHDIAVSIGYSYWFVWVLLYAIFTTWGVLRTLGVYGLVGSLIVVMLLPRELPLPHLTSFQAMYPFFVGGVLAYRYDLLAWLRKHSWGALVASIAVLVACYMTYRGSHVFYFFKYMPARVYFAAYGHLLLGGFASIVAMYTTTWLLEARCSKWRTTSLMARIGKYTLGIYLLQGLFVEVAKRYDIKIACSAVQWLLAIGVFTICAGAVYGISRTKHLSKWLLGK